MIKNTVFKDSGFTLIELLVTFGIVLSALLALFVGIIFAEKQLTKNYHDRRAILFASGALEWQHYKKQIYKTFDYDGVYIGPVVIDKIDNKTVNGNVGIDFWEGISQDGIGLKQTTITVEVKWNEPADNNKERTVRLVEDYYENPN